MSVFCIKKVSRDDGLVTCIGFNELLVILKQQLEIDSDVFCALSSLSVGQSFMTCSYVYTIEVQNKSEVFHA